MKKNFINAYFNILNESENDDFDDENLDKDVNSDELDNVDDSDNMDDSDDSNDVKDIENEDLTLDELIDKYESKEVITQDDIVDLLNIAICDEALASYNYMISYTLSKTEGKLDVDPEFQQHEKEEYEHLHMIINRLRELDADVMTIGWGDYLVKNSVGSEWTQETSNNSIDILRNRYNEELNAIKFYHMVLDCIRKMKESGNWDSTTERMIKQILADEEEHELDLRDILSQYEDVSSEPKTSFNPDKDSEDETDDDEIADDEMDDDEMDDDEDSDESKEGDEDEDEF